MVLPALALATAGVLATAAGAANTPTPPATKAGRSTPAVNLKTDESNWEFDDGSVASISDNPEPFVAGRMRRPAQPDACGDGGE